MGKTVHDVIRDMFEFPGKLRVRDVFYTIYWDYMDGRRKADALGVSGISHGRTDQKIRTVLAELRIHLEELIDNRLIDICIQPPLTRSGGIAISRHSPNALPESRDGRSGASSLDDRH